MEVQIRNDEGKLIWARSSVGGYTSRTYAFDTTLVQIRQALILALKQCNGELTVADNIERVAKVRTAAS